LAHREAALRTVGTLATDRYLGTGDDGWEGILRGGVYHIHKNLGVNESVMWGEPSLSRLCSWREASFEPRPIAVGKYGDA
jgi:hypothetical protein